MAATDNAMFSKTDEAAPGYYEPSQTALLLMDYHAFVVERVGGTNGAATVEVAADMRNWARSMGIQVVHALIDTEAAPFQTCKDFTMFATVADILRSQGEEPPQIRDGDGDVTFVRKPGHVSALRSPGLLEYLVRKDIKSLLLMGLSTSGCVLRTAAAATDLEYVVTTISDGCADPKSGVHEFLVESILGQRGYVVTSKEFQEGYSHRK